MTHPDSSPEVLLRPLFVHRFGPSTVPFPDTRKPHNDNDFRAFQPAPKDGRNTPQSGTFIPPGFAGASDRLSVPERLPRSAYRRRRRHGSTAGVPSGNGYFSRRRVLGPDRCRRDAHDKAPTPLKGNRFHRTRKASDRVIRPESHPGFVRSARERPWREEQQRQHPCPPVNDDASRVSGRRCRVGIFRASW